MRQRKGLPTMAYRSPFAGMVRVEIQTRAACGAESFLYVGTFVEAIVPLILEGLDVIGIAEASNDGHSLDEIVITTVRLGTRGQPLWRSFDVVGVYHGATSHKPAPAWSQEVAGNA